MPSGAGIGSARNTEPSGLATTASMPSLWALDEDRHRVGAVGQEFSLAHRPYRCPDSCVFSFLA
ncbi:hypothetical protein RKD42_008226 [Streptomyces ambofaciens]